MMWLAMGVAASLLLFVWWDATGDNKLNLAPRVADNQVDPVGPTESESVPKFAKDQTTSFERSFARATDFESPESAIGSYDDRPDLFTLEDLQPPKRRGIPLAGPVNDSKQRVPSANKKQNRQDAVPSALASEDSGKRIMKSEPVRLVSQNVDRDLRDYWQTIGVEPSEDVASEMVAQRIADILGVQVDVNTINDVERLQQQFSEPDSARAIVQQWLSGMVRGGVIRLDDDERSKLFGVLAGSLSNQHGFDRALTGLIKGQNAESAAWYALMSEQGEVPMRHRLASITMNIDLRCTRCHDDLIQNSGTQHDYWSFAALLKTGVQRDSESGRFVPYSGPNPRITRFYDLPDGRRGIARAGIPAEWLAADPAAIGSVPRVNNLKQWAESLNGSPRLAQSLVNSFWKTLHGRPLVGSEINAVAAPQNESLQRLQRRLADDLVASNFNVTRTIALMVASPSFRRSVPPSIDAKTSLLASNKDRQRAMRQIAAFAGSPPKQRQIGMPNRLAFVLRAAGSKIDFSDTDSMAILSQADDSFARRPHRGPTSRATAQLPPDFPTRGDSLPVKWLGTVKGFDEQTRHLAYLAGRTQVPEPVAGAVQAMRTSNVSDQLALQRVWWLLEK